MLQVLGNVLAVLVHPVGIGQIPPTKLEKRAVRILLECFLVVFVSTSTFASNFKTILMVMQNSQH